MHTYDPNGQIRQYRQERYRSDRRRAIGFAIAAVSALVSLPILYNFALAVIRGH